MPMWPNFGDYQRWLGFGDGAGMAGIGEYQRWVGFGDYASVVGLW